MDLGLEGRTAIVCASSRGLGGACAEALAREGVHVLITGRGREDVDAAVAALAAIGRGRIEGLACDVTASEGRAAMIAACPDADILVNNSAGPPPRAFLDIDAADWPPAVQRYMIAPLPLTPAPLPRTIPQTFA